MKIFVIGSYFEIDERQIRQNIDRANKAGVEILKKGHLPFVPQSMFAFWEKSVDTKSILKMCFDWIRECDAVLILNLGSKGGGTWKAKEYAKIKFKKIFNSLDEIPEV